MSDFQVFSIQVHQQFNAMQEHTLFRTLSGDELWDIYLKSFPEGTNPIFRERTEHDCSCCRNFVKNIGGLVAIVDGQRITVWDQMKGLQYPYNLVAARMSIFVEEAPITALFKTKEDKYGAMFNLERLEDGQMKRWNHFHAQVAPKHRTNEVGTEMGAYASDVQVFRRGLTEIPDSVVTDVSNLIAENAIYRGAEHASSVRSFQDLKKKYAALTSNGEDFVWSHARDAGARIRNTAIGTLLVDLSEGKSLEAAVGSFEAKVAPQNYKRTTALVTPSMVKAALKQIQDLGLEDSLDRRFATMSDVTLNNVLWVDRGSRGKLRSAGALGVLESMSEAKVKTTGVEQKMKLEEFMKTVAPVAESIELMMKNGLQSNLVSLTAPIHLDPQDPSKLFKWGNDFGWSYHGNIADSFMRQQVQARGGSVGGVLRFTHSWNHEDRRNASLMDLHVFMPGSGVAVESKPGDSYGSAERVGWNHRKHYASGGIQDVDYTAEAPRGYIPVENITFPDMKKLPDGQYICKIHNWQLRNPTEAGFKAEIEFGGQVFEYDYPKKMGNKEWVTVAVLMKKGDTFSIEHKLPHSKSSTEVWGIETEKYVKVKTIMRSPNFWDDQKIGNEHMFFLLEGCKNPERTRGIYNEFLKPSLEQHRKVFEMLGDKSKCDPIGDEQLSGVGISSTKGDSVTLMVSSGGKRQVYNVSF